MFESLICKDAKDPMTSAFMWTEPTVMAARIADKAKRLIEFLSRANMAE